MPPNVVEAVLCILGPAKRGSGGCEAAHMSAVGSHSGGRIAAAPVRLGCPKIDAQPGTAAGCVRLFGRRAAVTGGLRRRF